MSIEKAKISRSLVVKSPIHLWKIFNNKKDFYEKNSLVLLFNYSMDSYINGCKCDEERHRVLVMDEYNSIKEDDVVKSLILDELKCQNVIFTENEKW